MSFVSCIREGCNRVGDLSCHTCKEKFCTFHLKKHMSKGDCK